MLDLPGDINSVHLCLLASMFAKLVYTVLPRPKYLRNFQG